MPQVKHGRNRDALMDAILSGSLESVRFLIEEAHFPFEMHSKRGAATRHPAP